MRNQKYVVVSLTLVLGFLALSCAEKPPMEPRADTDISASAADGPQLARGLDAEFSRIAGEIPGFGGMFYDSDGRLNVFMTEVGREARAFEPELRHDLARSLERSAPMREHAARAARDIIVRTGQYDFRQLARWNEAMLPVLGVDGVVFTHIDESQNRLRIGMEARASRGLIERTVGDLGVPLDAVVIDLTEPIVPLEGTLRDVQRPRAGGPQIVFERPGVGFFVCTLGFSIDRSASGSSDPFFITNSHCSAERSQVTGTEYFQSLPEVFGGHTREFLGTEVVDPPFFTEPCFEGFVCRWSDALIGHYERANPVNFGAIYRTKFFGTGTSAGSLEVEDEEGKFFNIRDEIPFPQLNDVVNKIGRTTGWTQGPVVITCGNFSVAGADPPIAMLCQDVVAAASAGGDSGSPVFTRVGEKNVHLNGILWGGGVVVIDGEPIQVFVFSAMDNIRLELEPFKTH